MTYLPTCVGGMWTADSFQKWLNGIETSKKKDSTHTNDSSQDQTDQSYVDRLDLDANALSKQDTNATGGTGRGIFC